MNLEYCLSTYLMKTLFSFLLILWLAFKIVSTFSLSCGSCSLVYAQQVSSKHEVPSRPQSNISFYGDPDTSLEKAKELVKAGNYKEALSIISPFISQKMRYPAIYSDYLVILIWVGRIDEATRLFKALPKSFPKRPYLLRNMAKAYYDKKEFLKAASLYQDVIKQTPFDEEAQKGLVLSLMRVGNLERAFTVVEGFLERTPNSLPLLLTKAELLIRQGKYLEALAFYRLLVVKSRTEAEQIYKARDDLIASLTTDGEKDILQDLRNSVQGGNKKAILDYILALILTRNYNDAIKVFESVNFKPYHYSDHLLCWVAWSYFKSGKIEKARNNYQKVLSRNPGYARASIGTAYCFSVKGQREKAIEILDKLQFAGPYGLEVRFARAFVCEQAKLFWSAVQEYDGILDAQPENTIARKLRLLALSDMGASSFSLEEAYRELPSDHEVHHKILEDMAVDRIRWDEPKEALNILFPLVRGGKSQRSKIDYIVALIKSKRMKEAVDAYEKLVRDGISPPPWLLEELAGAYLYLEMPQKALLFYDEALKARPKSFDGRMNKFYTLQELREWDKASTLLNDIDKETPPFQALPPSKEMRDPLQPNWPKLEVAVARGWFLLCQDRLREGQDFFWDLHERAPANIDFRNGLAHAYLWRGWPRKALTEFEIIDTHKPEGFYQYQPGKIMTLNQLDFKEQAREEAKNHLLLHPKDKEAQRTVRELKVEDMQELSTDVAVSKEHGGTQDVSVKVTLSQPLSLYTRLYGFLSWRETKDDDHLSGFHRAGLGIDHIFNRFLDLRQQFSVNYEGGGDFGSLTGVNFQPDDYLSFNFLYDYFTTDIPMRARVFDIEADKLRLGMTYRESEWRSYRLSISRHIFSDGNDRDQALLGYEQGLYVKKDWMMRLFLDLFTSRNSRDDAPYFNPESDWSLSATYMIQHTAWRIYTRTFVQRLLLALGNYKQSGFSNNVTCAIRYEQNHEFSDTQALLWGINLSRNIYDGDPVNSFNLYLNYRWRF